MTVARDSSLSTVLLFVALTGCAPETILIAQSEDGGLDAQVDASLVDTGAEAGSDDATFPPASDASVRSDAGYCFDTNNCQPGWYCAKLRCGDARGTCAIPPRQCDEFDFGPVCGCNGITYFNDCLRQLDGVGAHNVGECTGPQRRRCAPFSGVVCPRSKYCALIDLTDQCGFNGVAPEGKCWDLPGDCSMSRDAGAVFQRCGGPRPAERECVGLCDAIHDQSPYALSPNCPRRPPTFP
jgi:hypothetical protein